MENNNIKENGKDLNYFFEEMNLEEFSENENKEINRIFEKTKRKEEFFKNHKDLIKQKDSKNKKSFKEKEKKRKIKLKLKHRDENFNQLKNKTEEEKIEFYYKKFQEKLLKEAKIKKELKLAYNSNFIICFDLGYDSYMTEKERISLSLQLTHCYSLNKHNITKISFYFTNISKEMKNLLNKRNADKWQVHYYIEPFYLINELIMKNKEFVYLSPDAEEEIEDINEEKIYIIGGLVDRTIDTNRSLLRVNNLLESKININEEMSKFYNNNIDINKNNKTNNNINYFNNNYNIKLVAKKLPLKKYLDNIKNPVLNVNTVVEIISYYLDLEKGNKDWKKTFESVLPKKKTKKIKE